MAGYRQLLDSDCRRGGRHVFVSSILIVVICVCCLFASAMDDSALIVEFPKASLAAEVRPVSAQETKKYWATEVIDALYRSAERWSHVLESLPKIEIGQTREEVIGILGNPDDGDQIPGNVLQYSVYGAIRPVGEQGLTLIVELNESDRVRGMRRVSYTYGPLQEPIPFSRVTEPFWTDRSRSSRWDVALRWMRILDGLEKIKEGDSREEVIRILGQPRAIGSTSNFMQYAYYANAVPKGQDKHIAIELDQDAKVRAIRRTKQLRGVVPIDLSLRWLAFKSDVILIGKVIRTPGVLKTGDKYEHVQVQIIRVLKGDEKLKELMLNESPIVYERDTKHFRLEESKEYLFFLLEQNGVYAHGGLGPYESQSRHNVLLDDGWKVMSMDEMAHAVEAILSTGTGRSIGGLKSRNHPRNCYAPHCRHSFCRIGIGES